MNKKLVALFTLIAVLLSLAAAASAACEHMAYCDDPTTCFKCKVKNLKIDDVVHKDEWIGPNANNPDIEHYTICLSCNTILERELHYSNCNSPKVCVVCRAKEVTMSEVCHSEDGEIISKDDDKHVYACSRCKVNVTEEHYFDEDTGICDVCEYKKGGTTVNPTPTEPDTEPDVPDEVDVTISSPSSASKTFSVKADKASSLTATFKAKVKVNGKNKSASVTWSSSDTNVVVVSSKGVVTVVGPGTAKVTASYEDASDSVDVKVTFPTAKIKDLKSPKSRKVTFNLSASSKISSFEVAYRAEGKGDWKTMTYTPSSSSGKSASVTLSKLIKGTRYELRTRAKFTVGGNVFYTAWSEVQTVVAKR